MYILKKGHVLMSAIKILNAKQKAFAINLESNIYGSFAEIGAGQEVARQFFQAGGSAGTIAKTISAYDMAFSDSIYGKEKSGRYVCETRVLKMITHEYKLLESRLKSRSSKTQFFAFANTVAAKSFSSKNGNNHGWFSIRFQDKPKNKPSDIILHSKMLDKENIQQQEALGILGTNLIYAAFFRENIDLNLLKP